MNRDVIKQILADQREMYQVAPLIQRETMLEDSVNYCFVGIRRTGKSYMMYQKIADLLGNGVPEKRILYATFEDERLMEADTEDLNTILEIGLELAGDEGKPYIFLDELQNVPGWEKFVRRLADTKYRVSITGSNSKMFSSEIASTLGGRFLPVTIYPYSFREFLAANERKIPEDSALSTKEKAEIIGLCTRYIREGAFPGLVYIKDKRKYLSGIYETIYLGDIIARNEIRNPFAIRLMLKKIAESVMKPLSYTRLHNILQSAGISIGKQTVITYMGFIRESYLLFPVENYAGKLVDKETSPKYYFMDTGILGLLLMNCETAQLENLVAIELLRRYGEDKFFYFERNTEIDFYVPEEDLAIQVCYNLFGSEDTKNRELQAFVKFRSHFPDAKCLVISNSEEREITVENVTVSVVPIWKWLVKRKCVVSQRG